MSRYHVRLAPAFVLALAAACTDAPSPTAPRTPPLQLAAQGGGNGKTSLDLIEEDFGAGLLDRDNGNRYRAYAVMAPEKLPSKYKSVQLGKDATYSMVQMQLDWDGISKSTQQEILNLQGTGFGNLKETAVTPHFVLHYTRQGASAVPAQDDDRNGTPDFIDLAAQSWERIWEREISELGYPAPKGTPAQRFHVYYQHLTYYGYTMPANVELLDVTGFPYGTASAWIVIENDFAGFPFNDIDRTGLEAVRKGALWVTQAHEFMHASQFNMNVYQSGWLMESHATWAEDAVYDQANDWHWYINRFLVNPDVPIFSRYVYGSAFFQNWLSETYGIDTPRRVWEAAKHSSTPDAIRTAVFGGSWEGMKTFAPAEYLLGISDFTTDAPSSIPAPHNVIRATHDSYPVSVEVPASTNRLPNRAPWALGANFIDFTSAESGALTLSFDGADGYAWRAYAVATPAGGGKPAITEIRLDPAGAGSITISGLGSRYSKVTLVPTIAGSAGVAVPYVCGATMGPKV